MNVKDYTFPHPILGLGDKDIDSNINIGLLLDESSDESYYILQLKYETDNKDILNLISENKALYYCEINCSPTLYRKAHLSRSEDFTIKIPKDYVREKVELLFLITASENIPEYQNSKSHLDFNGYKFYIEKGDILAYLGESHFIAGITYNKLKAASSFMEIVRGENEEGDYNIILDNNKIQIQLSHKDYDKYVDPAIGKNSSYKNIIHASFVLSTLIFALNQLLNTQKSEDLIQKSWAKIIEFRMHNDKDLKDIPFEQENVCKIAQILLGMPGDRLLTDLLTLFSLSNREE